MSGKRDVDRSPSLKGASPTPQDQMNTVHEKLASERTDKLPPSPVNRGFTDEEMAQWGTALLGKRLVDKGRPYEEGTPVDWNDFPPILTAITFTDILTGRWREKAEWKEQLQRADRQKRKILNPEKIVDFEIQDLPKNWAQDSDFVPEEVQPDRLRLSIDPRGIVYGVDNF